MPSKTATRTGEISSAHSILSLKATSPSSSSSAMCSTGETSTLAALRSLYSRAAKAFLHRDIPLTYALIISAFNIIQPPTSFPFDPLDTHRRKWDILRITLETTVYSSPPPSSELTTIPPSLRANLLLSSQSFVMTLHTRSVLLFTPSIHSKQPSSAFLPVQILVTLILSSLKVDCPEVSRGIIEDWLDRRGQSVAASSDTEAYERIIDLYCLHVLSRLEEWDYAQEFLQYERELSVGAKLRIQGTLQRLHVQCIEACKSKRGMKRASASPPLTFSQSQTSFSSAHTPLTTRSSSPAPSISSSSSLSTTSTRTAVPGHLLRDARLSCVNVGNYPRASAQSMSSDITVTRRTSRQRSQTPSVSRLTAGGMRSLSLPRAPPSTLIQQTVSLSQPPSMLALVQASLRPYLSASQVATFLFLFALLPLASLVFKLRRRVNVVSRAKTATELARRRLESARGDSILRILWKELVHAVTDTVRMGGGGLV